MRDGLDFGNVLRKSPSECKLVKDGILLAGKTLRKSASGYWLAKGGGFLE